MTFSEAPAQLSLAKIIARLFAMPAATTQVQAPRSYPEILSRLLETLPLAVKWHESCYHALAGSLEICHCRRDRTGLLSNSLRAIRGWRWCAGGCPENGRAKNK